MQDGPEPGGGQFRQAVQTGALFAQAAATPDGRFDGMVGLAIGSGAANLGASIGRDYGSAQGNGQVQRAGVVGHHDVGEAEDSGELG